MTLGSYLTRRALRITALAVIITLPVWGVIEWVPGLERFRSDLGALLFLLVFIGFGAANGARCPRCGAALYGMQPGPRNRHGEPIPVGSDCCNQCGLHYKEELRATDNVDTWP